LLYWLHCAQGVTGLSKAHSWWRGCPSPSENGGVEEFSGDPTVGPRPRLHWSGN